MNTTRGFSYLEVLVAVVFISIAFIPIIDSLRTTTQSYRGSSAFVNDTHHLASKMEELLGESFSNLYAAAQAAGSPTVTTNYSDAAGASERRLVYIASYDVDNSDTDNNGFTGVEEEVLWIKVEIENTEYAIETLFTND